VEVADGVVTLAGEVETRGERRAAEDVAAEVSGVVDVINRIHARQRHRGHPS
jgi:osmotically-inducible protein OsmY